MLTPKPPFSKKNRELLLPEAHEYINPETVDCVNILSDEGSIENLSVIDFSADNADIGKIYNSDFIKTPLIYAEDIQTVTLEASDTITSIDIKTVRLKASEKITSVDIETSTLTVNDTLISKDAQITFLSAYDISTSTFKSIVYAQLSNIKVMGNSLTAADRNGNIELYPSSDFDPEQEDESKGIIVLNKIDLDKSTFTSHYPIPVPATETDPAIVSTFTFKNPVNIIGDTTITEGPLVVDGDVSILNNHSFKVSGDISILNNHSLNFVGGVDFVIQNNQSNKNLFSYSWPSPQSVLAPPIPLPGVNFNYLGVDEEGDSTIMWNSFLGANPIEAVIGYSIGPYLSYDLTDPETLMFKTTDVDSCIATPMGEPYTTTVGPFLTDTLGDKTDLQWYMALVINLGCLPLADSCSMPSVSFTKLETPPCNIQDGKIKVFDKEYIVEL